MTSSETKIENLFTLPIQSGWFTDSFLQAISLDQIESSIAEIKNSFGLYQSLQPDEDAYLVSFERGQVVVQMTLDANDQIIYLLFQPSPQILSPEQAVQALKTFPGQTNLLVLADNRELISLNCDRPLAVGSTFKLAVLAALRQQMATGRTWSEVVALQPQWKSLGSGMLQDWFDNALLTVQTLATLMIAQSDNTATDALINLVGREAVEAESDRNRPFLTTREAFLLKAASNRTLLAQYRAAELNQRRQILQQLQTQPLPSGNEFTADPTALDIEWFFTPHELCQLMTKVADLPLMSVNPGGTNPTDWQRIAYKGGSEPGVLSLTTWLESASGHTYCISATWNDQSPLDEQRLYRLYSGLIASLKAA